MNPPKTTIAMSGIAKVYFAELPKEVQERFNYNPASAAQFRATVQAAAAQFTTATPQKQTQVAADNLHTIREVETDQPSFLDQPFILKGKIDVSDYYNWGYQRAQETHYAFEITDSSAHPCNAYMERAKAAELRQQLLDAGRPLKGMFTVVLLSGRHHNSQVGLLLELLDYRLER